MTKLADDLAAENNIMDQLAAHTTQSIFQQPNLPMPKKKSKNFILSGLLLKVLLEMLMPYSPTFSILMTLFLQSLFGGLFLTSFVLVSPC